VRRRRGRRGAADQLERPRVDENPGDAVSVALGEPLGVSGDRIATAIYCRRQQRRHYASTSNEDPDEAGDGDPEPYAFDGDINGYINVNGDINSDINSDINGNINSDINGDINGIAYDGAGSATRQPGRRWRMIVTMQGGLEECET
jgi:hypothetical protein